VGNHEKYGESSALDFLEKIKYPNWSVYTTITNNVKIGDKTASFVPFLTPSMVGATDIKKGATKAVKELTGGSYAFLHQGITGAKTSGGLVDLFNEIVLSKASLEKKYDFIASGHIHKAQKLSGKSLMTGSIQTMEVGEHDKSVWVLNTKDNSVECVPLPVRGIYGVTQPEHLDTQTIPTSSIVKLTLTKSGQDIEEIKKKLSVFDSGILVEKYPKERRKVHFEKGGMDFSIDNLMKVFAKTRDVSYNDLKEGLDIIET
jgi:DNA repair exonuclease SbcCD nuclease subunit